MKSVDLTPALLAELRDRAERVETIISSRLRTMGVDSAVVLALVAEVERLRAELSGYEIRALHDPH